MNLPIIKIEIDHMRESIAHLISERDLEIDNYVQAALDKLCSAEAIQGLVEEATQKVVQEVVSQSVRSFFQYGEGYAAISGLVRERLKQELTKVERNIDAPGQPTPPPPGAV